MMPVSTSPAPAVAKKDGAIGVDGGTAAGGSNDGIGSLQQHHRARLSCRPAGGFEPGGRIGKETRENTLELARMRGEDAPGTELPEKLIRLACEGRQRIGVEYHG